MSHREADLSGCFPVFLCRLALTRIPRQVSRARLVCSTNPAERGEPAVRHKRRGFLITKLILLFCCKQA